MTAPSRLRLLVPPEGDRAPAFGRPSGRVAG
jgi:hypothetical protein